jgi:hypothetical protein
LIHLSPSPLTVAEKYRDWTDETPDLDEILAIATFWCVFYILSSFLPYSFPISFLSSFDTPPADTVAILRRWIQDSFPKSIWAYHGASRCSSLSSR